MRIYRMTATFGKLEHQTLELQPGLNIITAPNEWGKSTWCAFLVAMLYGLDTRAKTTKNNLADKERYAPWSGSPMSGRIDLNWNGRDITIERATTRRIPMGEFRAYETHTGLPIPELTAANCGQLLLGVEQTVFRRAGFIRHADLPVTQDEALRRRLNALVTTGDETGAGDKLAASLKELRNRCRYNRTGLLPEAETERDALREKLGQLETLEVQTKKLEVRAQQVKQSLEQLYNHRQALEYARAQEIAAKTARAKDALNAAEEKTAPLAEAVRELPPARDAEQMVLQLQDFREQWNAVEAEEKALPEEPVRPRLPAPFTGMEPEEAREMVRSDGKTYVSITGTKMPGLLIAMGVLGLAAAGLLVYLMAYIFAAVAGAASLVALIWGIAEKVSLKKKTRNLLDKYGDGNYKRWADPVNTYEKALRAYRTEYRKYLELKQDVEVRMMVLRKKRETLCGENDPQALLDRWTEIRGRWQAFTAAEQERVQAKDHYETLNAMVRPVEAPALPDELTYTAEETGKLLSEFGAEQQRLQLLLGRYQGKMASMGDKALMEKQLELKIRRIARLEENYAALTMAQETLTRARTELQRRFAPRITRRAQKLMAAMTGGRYSTVIMTDDFALQTRSGEEDIHRDALWRSDGTMDQLYLALRLAVAEELTPNAPVVLDDALVRFDDERMQTALELLEEMSHHKQVILFTCQGREKAQ